ncbi:MAG TPA: hypothetical protein PLD25_32660 [Chloroflexota bacterium]|nr:hypothetical protein [Chloroflexota bacterium]HUM69541.1 hypothetical protein [Chloroflexota bacterium]
MTVKVIELNSKIDSDERTIYTMIYTIGETRYTTEIEIVLEQVGVKPLQVVRTEHAFWQNIQFNGPIAENLNELIRNVEAGEIIELPFVLGRLDDKYP